MDEDSISEYHPYCSGPVFLTVLGSRNLACCVEKENLELSPMYDIPETAMSRHWA